MIVEHSLTELAFTAIVLGLAAGFAPGPLLTLVIGESLRHGTRAGFLVAVAPLVTDIPIVLATLYIVDHFHDVDPFLGLIAIGGAAFLTYLGIEGLRVRPPHLVPHATKARPFQKGLVTNALNPNTYLFWFTVGAATLAAAIRTGPGHVLIFLVGMYGAFVASKTLVGWLTARSRGFLRSTGYLWTNRVLGLALLVFAGLFLVDGIRRLT